MNKIVLISAWIAGLAFGLAQAAPIKITADSVIIQEQDVSVYKGNVRLEKDNLTLQAEKIVITHYNKTIQVIDIEGNKHKPARLQIKKSDINASAMQIHYEVDREKLHLKGQVQWQQGENLIKAHILFFDQKNNILSAKSSQNGRIITEFESSQ